MPSRRQSVSKIFLMLLFMLSVSFAVRAQQQVDPKLYGGMKWRLIGPFRGGRAIAVSGVRSHRQAIARAQSENSQLTTELARSLYVEAAPVRHILNFPETSFNRSKHGSR